MMRNLKALMLAAVAALSLSAVGATAAQAAEFHSSAASTTLKTTADGTGKAAHQVFDAAGASITCAGVEIVSGTIAGATTSSVTVKVKYTGACTFVGQAATVEMRGCDYKFNASGTVDLVGANCAAEPIRFSVPSPPCTVTVGPQSGLSSVKYNNIKPGAKSEITLEPTVTGITYTATGSGCPQTGTKSDGNYTTGNVIVTGEASGSMVDISWG
jgi:hypothetical protein